MNKFTKQGYRVQYYPPPISDDLLAELRVISDDWLEHMQGAEKKFSLGWFDPTTCATAKSPWLKMPRAYPSPLPTWCPNTSATKPPST
jgi:hypothetical protein